MTTRSPGRRPQNSWGDQGQGATRRPPRALSLRQVVADRRDNSGMNKKAVIYTRNPARGRPVREWLGDATQLETCTAYCQERGLSVCRVYEEHASAEVPLRGRPCGINLAAALEGTEYDPDWSLTLVVVVGDRLAGGSPQRGLREARRRREDRRRDHGEGARAGVSGDLSRIHPVRLVGLSQGRWGAPTGRADWARPRLPFLRARGPSYAQSGVSLPFGTAWYQASLSLLPLGNW